MTDQHPAGGSDLLYDFLAGRQLGYNRSDAGYFRRGTRAVRGRPGSWAMQPGWKRQMFRLGSFAAAGGSWAAYTAAPTLTTSAAATLAGIGAVKGVRAGRRAWRMRKFRAVYIRPTLGALRPALGDAPVQLHVSPELGGLVRRITPPMSQAEVDFRAWYGEKVEPVVRWLPDQAMRGWWAVQKKAAPLTGRLDYFRRPVDGEHGPRIELTASLPYLTDEQRRYVSSVVGSKIPAGELVEAWDQVGEKVRVVWTVRRRPPSRVGYADLAARLDALSEWEYFLGLGVGGKPVTISLQDDSPHVACSAGSGAGKSVLAQLIGVQVLARGGMVVILDLKGSHRWALGLPGVDYCTTPEQMHKALVRLAALADERNTLALHEAEGWDPGQRFFVIAEELNATFTRLKDYWSDERAPSDPKTSPAVKAFRNLLFMGRSAKINVFAVAQMLTANTTGGPESRENFGIRCLARYTKNNWQMLVPEASMPRASRTLGRWQVVVGGEARETQVCYLTGAEARLLVHKARAAVHVDAQTLDASYLAKVHMDAPVSAEPANLMTLQDSINEGWNRWSLPATQKRLQRARAATPPTAPTARGKRQRADLYDRGELIAWIESELVS